MSILAVALFTVATQRTLFALANEYVHLQFRFHRSQATANSLYLVQLTYVIHRSLLSHQIKRLGAFPKVKSFVRFLKPARIPPLMTLTIIAYPLKARRAGGI